MSFLNGADVNWVYLHITINHIPIILTGLGFLATLVAFGSRKRVVWIYALATLTLSGLSVYPVFFAGSQAEDIVMDHDRNARDAIDDHEEAADWALWTVLVTGALSAYGLYRMRKDVNGVPPVWFRAVILVAGLFAIATVVRTSIEGGAIRHADWERTLSAPPPSPAAPKS